MIKTIIFDFGDVLVRDTAHYFEKRHRYEKLSPEKKQAYDKAYHLSETGKISGNQLLKAICQTLAPNMTPEQIKEETLKSNKVLPTVKLLPKLAKNYRVMILSNNHKGHSAKTFKKLGLNLKPYPFINSAKVGVRKPNPKIYRYAIDKYHLNPKETIFIDDKAPNVVAAKKFGIHAFQYRQKLPALISFLKRMKIQGL